MTSIYKIIYFIFCRIRKSLNTPSSTTYNFCVFRYSGVYLAVVPSYIGGFMALTWVSNDAVLGDPSRWQGLDTAFAASRIATDYYTPAMHRAAFALPAWIERLVRT